MCAWRRSGHGRGGCRSSRAQVGGGRAVLPCMQWRAGGLGVGQASAVAWSGRLVRLCPRRSRCTGCGVTHVLLPVSALLRRADAAAVIVSALVAKAMRRVGFRRIAAELARPAETVRGWLRRFVARAEAVRSVFTVWLRAVDPDPVMPGPAGGGLGDALAAIGAVSAAIGRRFVLSGVSLAETAVAVSGGQLLTPGWPGADVQHEPTLPRSPITP